MQTKKLFTSPFTHLTQEYRNRLSFNNRKSKIFFRLNLAAFICSTEVLLQHRIVLPERSVFIEAGHIGCQDCNVSCVAEHELHTRRTQDEHRKIRQAMVKPMRIIIGLSTRFLLAK